MAKVDCLHEFQVSLSNASRQYGEALELCIDNDDASVTESRSLESSMSTYDSMMQTLNNELNDGLNVDPELMDFEDLDFFNMDCATAMSVEYEMNYTMKQLKHVAGYYGIKCKNRKVDIIQDIVAYETDSENHDIVSRRKRLFHYMNVLKNDEYFKTFVIM